MTDTAALLRRLALSDGLVAYRSPALEELGVPHLFTTRRGAGRELDAARLDAADEARLARAAGAPGARLARASQVHGDGVLEVDRVLPGPEAEADALVTSRADRLVSVRVADCVPVLVARADGGRVAAVHAGWRGLAAGVVERAVARVADGAPASGASGGSGGSGGDLVAAVGPCLSLARFEVGEEVAEAFRAAGLGASVHPGAEPGARPHVDLRGAAELALARAGVERIDATDRCTWTHADEFWSYRREGASGLGGRMAALIAPRA